MNQNILVSKKKNKERKTRNTDLTLNDTALTFQSHISFEYPLSTISWIGGKLQR